MHSEARQKAKRFRSEHHAEKITLQSLRAILRSQGYTIVEFNNIFNDENVTILIEALRLEDQIQRCKGFTYADRYRRLVFLNEDLSDDEKLLVLAHEEGHIYCNHFTSAPIIGRDVVEEHEASEFAHYLLDPSAAQRSAAFLRRNLGAVVAASVLLIVAVIVGIAVGKVQNEKRYYGEYYLTSTGNKYHEKECIFVKDKTSIHRMTVEEFESGEYERCAICLPPDKDPSPSEETNKK